MPGMVALVGVLVGSSFCISTTMSSSSKADFRRLALDVLQVKPPGVGGDLGQDQVFDYRVCRGRLCLRVVSGKCCVGSVVY